MIMNRGEQVSGCSPLYDEDAKKKAWLVSTEAHK
jgi:hypothetical protein